MEDFITIPFLCKKFERGYKAIQRTLEYLNIRGKTYGHKIGFPLSCIDALEKFYRENPNPKTLFFQESCVKKYGEIHPSKVEEIKNRKKETTRKHYGVEHPSQNEEIKNKTKETNLKKYGFSCTLLNRGVHDKVLKTNNEKYGCSNPMQNREVQDKLFSSNLEKYGNRCTLHGINQQNTIQNKKKSQIKDKIELEKIYGTLYSFNELTEIFNKDITTISLVVSNLSLEKIKGKVLYINQTNFDKLSEYFKTTENAIYSYSEKNMADYIKSIYCGDVILNDRKVLDGKELDIYIPEKAVAIEFNGIYWHSDLPFVQRGELTKDLKEINRTRHLIKYQRCAEKGIRLIQFFEDEWVNQIEICKSIIASSLGIYKEKIYARNCEVKEIDVDTYNDFMLTNHIQGYAKTTLRLGLFCDDRLVQCMGFSKGTHRTDEIELNRMASLLNTQVLGGFSKLIKYACRTYDFKSVYSYIADRLYAGKGYESIGFEKLYKNDPTYFYVKNTMRRFPRYEFKRSDIERKFNEGKLSYWNPEETEEINMYKNGYGRIYDCGTTKVVYKV